MEGSPVPWNNNISRTRISFPNRKRIPIPKGGCNKISNLCNRCINAIYKGKQILHIFYRMSTIFSRQIKTSFLISSPICFFGAFIARMRFYNMFWLSSGFSHELQFLNAKMVQIMIIAHKPRLQLPNLELARIKIVLSMYALRESLHSMLSLVNYMLTCRHHFLRLFFYWDKNFLAFLI